MELIDRYKERLEANTLSLDDQVLIHVDAPKEGDKSVAVKHKPFGNRPEVEVTHLALPWQGKVQKCKIGAYIRTTLLCANHYRNASEAWANGCTIRVTDLDKTPIDENALRLDEETVKLLALIKKAEAEAREEYDKEIEALDNELAAKKSGQARIDALRLKKLEDLGKLGEGEESVSATGETAEEKSAREEADAANSSKVEENTGNLKALERDDLKALATDLKIEYPANVPTDKLVSLIAEKQAENG